MLYLIGLGLGDVEDITVKGLKIIKSAKRVYFEVYTSVFNADKEKLEAFYGRELIPADRELVESNSDEILRDADVEDIAFLVVGDPLGATTHADLILRAKSLQIPYKVVHNASIVNAVGSCGLQLYRFGEIVSIVLWNEAENWKPTSFFSRIVENKKRGLHTLCLLDIKMKEQTVENMIKGRKIYEPPRFMTTRESASQLLEIIKESETEGDAGVINRESLCVGLARVGCDDQSIVVNSLSAMSELDLGPPLHSLIIPGSLHPIEVEMLRLFSPPGFTVE